MVKTNPIIIIGGGPAGLMAALSAGYQCVPALVLEKGPTCGRKLQITGGGRGNLTNLNLQSGWQAPFPTDPYCSTENAAKILRPLHTALPPSEIRKIFHNLGVETYADEEGRVYPVSNRAQDLSDALQRGVLKTGGIILTNMPVVNILTTATDATASLQATLPDWQVVTEREIYHTSNLIITTGGASYPQTGSTGDGNRLFAQTGLPSRPFTPALTAIIPSKPFPQEFAGITLPDVSLSYLVRGKHKNIRRQRRGSLLFQRKGLSGPVALNSSADLSDPNRFVEGSLHLNFLPALSQDEFRQELRGFGQSHPKQQISRFLETLLPSRLASYLWAKLCAEQGFATDTRFASLSTALQEALTAELLSYPLTPTSPPPIRTAMASRGGLDPAQINFRTMETKRPGLYAAGECIDLDFVTGGFHLTFAFESGFVAGKAAAAAAGSLTT